MTFMKVKASSIKADLEHADEKQISTSKTHLTYVGQSEAGASEFSYSDAAGKEYQFEFNLQYYNPSAGEKPNKATSGAYLFVPELLD